jgi:hypothetical protein
MAKEPSSRQIPAIKVHQWLKGWDEIPFSAKQHRRRPPPHFYVFSLPAVELRALCGIARRTTSGMIPRAVDLGIQREHDAERSSGWKNFAVTSDWIDVESDLAAALQTLIARVRPPDEELTSCNDFQTSCSR